MAALLPAWLYSSRRVTATRIFLAADLTLFHPERPKLHTILAFLSAIGLIIEDRLLPNNSCSVNDALATTIYQLYEVSKMHCLHHHDLIDPYNVAVS